MELHLAGIDGGSQPPLVRVLGRFRVEVEQQPIQLPIQAQRVVGYLAVTGSCERRDRLAGRLWPFSPQCRADANLRTALWRIGSTGPGLLDTSRTFVSLQEDVEVDVRTARARARSLIDSSVDTASPVTTPGLWEDDLLVGWDEEWLVIERERMRQLRIHGLEALSRSLARCGRFSEAIDAALTAIAAEPLRESAHTALIEAHIAEGNHSEANRELESYRLLLRHELGLDPSAALVDFVRRGAARSHRGQRSYDHAQEYVASCPTS